MKKGDRVQVTTEGGRRLAATVELVSGNGKSIALLVDGEADLLEFPGVLVDRETGQLALLLMRDEEDEPWEDVASGAEFEVREEEDRR